SNTFTVTADSTASVGSAQIQIENLASAHKLVSTNSYAGPTTAVGAGTMNISVGSSSFSVNIVGGQNNTLAGIRDAINNATGNKGVTASIMTVSNGSGGTVSHLVLSADESGAANAINVTVTGDADGNDTDAAGLSSFVNANMQVKGTATDAKMIVDGFEVYSSSNVFKDAIQGVSITAVKANPGVVETVNVGVDKTAIKTNLATFVEQFNALAETLDYLTKYDPETEEAGLLTGDSTTRFIESQLRRTITNAVSELGGSSFNSLASIGITTQRDGTLKLDSTKLDKALASNFDDVAQLLGGEHGIAKKLDKALDGMLKTGGLISSRNSTFMSQLEDIDEQREKLETRIASYEERLRRQYSSLDMIVSNLNSTGDYIQQQMDSIAGISRSKK
ncbi:MAG TPA: flagellar filament capping protein FliD, partial [Dongiaceae bacterium]|nr:flagellar filament capping protein FliD [Dongiaceae bacterium]